MDRSSTSANIASHTIDSTIHKSLPASDSDASYDLMEDTIRQDDVAGKGHISLTPGLVAQWGRELYEDPKNRLAGTALALHGKDVLLQRARQIKDTQTFNVKIAIEGAPMMNQRSSGRCWIYASTNCFRVGLMRRYNLKELELSTSYLFYWDKLEKSNWFLRQILDTINEPLDGRLLQTLLADPLGDGGQWDMIANLVEKYGLVPQAVYPDTYNSQNSSGMRSLMTTKLRENALTLRKLATETSPYSSAKIEQAVEGMLREMHCVLTLMLGPPPSTEEKFTWDFYDKEDKLHSLEMTPLDLVKELISHNSGDNLAPYGEEAKSSKEEATIPTTETVPPKSVDKTKTGIGGMSVYENFSLVHDPRNKFNTLLSVSRLGNCMGMRPVRYVNVELETMKEAIISMLRANIPVFFGSDVGKFSHRVSGIMDVDLLDYKLGFGLDLNLTKAERLETGESAMTHAMVLTAVHLDSAGKPVRWRVQNSWGETSGSKGWFVMTDRWLDQFVYQAVVDPKFVSEKVCNILKQEPTMLELWDPMGALA